MSWAKSAGPVHLKIVMGRVGPSRAEKIENAVGRAGSGMAGRLENVMGPAGPGREFRNFDGPGRVSLVLGFQKLPRDVLALSPPPFQVRARYRHHAIVLHNEKKTKKQQQQRDCQITRTKLDIIRRRNKTNQQTEGVELLNLFSDHKAIFVFCFFLTNKST